MTRLSDALFPRPAMVRGEARPEPTPPVDETRPGPVFAYRGQQTHGVDPGQPWDDVDEYGDSTVDVVDDTPPHREKPIPVFLTRDENASEEFNDWRVIATAVSSVPAMIVNRQRNRSRVVIKNVGTVDILINHAANVTTLNGFVIKPADSFVLNTTEEVWGVSSDGSVVSVQIVAEFATQTN